MRLRITNYSAKILDVLGFDFESAGALERVNEHSGLAVPPAHYIAFEAPKQAHPAAPLYHFGGEP
jgi:hypothetical protein